MFSNRLIEIARQDLARFGDATPPETRLIAETLTSLERENADRAAQGLPPLPFGMEPLYSN